jgi:hypothetical protein
VKRTPEKCRDVLWLRPIWLAVLCGLVGCGVLNPPNESRVFYPKDWNCSMERRTMTCALPQGLALEGFLFVGKDLWLEQRSVIDECVENGLAEMKDY